MGKRDERSGVKGSGVTYSFWIKERRNQSSERRGRGIIPGKIHRNDVV